MSSELSGGCDCGGVSYKIAPAEMHVYVCHCLKCQTRSGSAFAQHAMIGASALSIEGETVSRSRASNGGTVDEIHCATCFTGIYNRNSMLPDTLFLRAGTLFRSQGLVPLAHVWTKRKQPWINIPDDVPSFPESPTPEQFFAIISKAAR